jgi:tryptophanyl-tRNA synthetase
MVPGLDGHPKMAKRIPGSGISMGMPPETVRQRVREADDSARPATSTVFQMLALASEHDADRLDELAAACRHDSEDWDAAVEAYAAFLADLAASWPDDGSQR